MAFGRRRRQQTEPNKKLIKVAKRGAEAAEKRCRAGSCSYSAVREASTSRVEATHKDEKGAGARSASWDCHSALYDSFELDSFSHKLGHSLAQERIRSNVASSSWHSSSRRSYMAPPLWHSRRHAGTAISCFPSCFPKRVPTIQLGKRKGPTFQGALHVVAKLARRGCHVIARIPACTARLGGQVQTHHHYHHHVHQVTLGGASQGNNHEELKPTLVPPPHFHLAEPTFCLSPNSLNHAYIPLEEEMDHHFTSIKYQP